MPRPTTTQQGTLLLLPGAPTPPEAPPARRGHRAPSTSSCEFHRAHRGAKRRCCGCCRRRYHHHHHHRRHCRHDAALQRRCKPCGRLARPRSGAWWGRATSTRAGNVAPTLAGRAVPTLGLVGRARGACASAAPTNGHRQPRQPHQPHKNCAGVPRCSWRCRRPRRREVACASMPAPGTRRDRSRQANLRGCVPLRSPRTCRSCRAGRRSGSAASSQRTIHALEGRCPHRSIRASSRPRAQAAPRRQTQGVAAALRRWEWSSGRHGAGILRRRGECANRATRRGASQARRGSPCRARRRPWGSQTISVLNVDRFEAKTTSMVSSLG